MLKKILIVLVLLPLICLVISVGAIYAYASSEKEKSILKVNLFEASAIEDIEYVVQKDVDESKVTTTIPFAVDEPTTIEDKPTYYTITIDKKENKVTTLNETTNETEIQTIEEYEGEAGIIHDYNVWGQVIDEGKYKIEDVDLDGRAMWKYTLDDQRLTEDSLKSYKKAFEEELTSGNNVDEDMKTENINFVFDGKFTFEIYIDKEDLLMKKVIMTANAPLTVTFDFAGKGIDEMIEAFKSLGQPVPSTTTTIKVEDSKYTSDTKEIRFEEGKSMPKNPVLLFWAAL